MDCCMSFDWTVLRWIQSTLVCPAMDFLMSKITLLGNGGAVWILAAVVLLATKKYRKFGAFLLAGLVIGVLTGNLTLKPLIARPRPCWLDKSVQLLIDNPTDYSFSSGHTLSSVIGTTVLTKENRKFGLAAIPAGGAHRVFAAVSLRPFPDRYPRRRRAGCWNWTSDLHNRKQGKF